MRQLLASLLLVTIVWACQPAAKEEPAAPAWVSLFDGKTMEGWTPKIRGHALGDNYANTFRVEEGAITVGYEGYEGEYADRFGHLFYKSPYSSYRFRMQYRFFGEQATAGPDWAWRNSGIMVHCQDPQSMAVEQDFPLCIEVQLLGGRDSGERSTANLCTPGTNVVMDGELRTDHCFNSSSKTYPGDGWVNVMVEVFGDSLIRHIVEGDTVLTYTNPQVGGGAISPAYPAAGPDGTPLGKGWISLQSESHPVAFRNIEIMEL